MSYSQAVLDPYAKYPNSKGMIGTFKVICQECQGDSTVLINQWGGVEWKRVNRVISARERLDGQWGWQCICGNNNLITKQERESIKDLTSPQVKELDDIKSNLVVEKDTSFNMVKV